MGEEVFGLGTKKREGGGVCVGLMYIHHGPCRAFVIYTYGTGKP